MLLESPYQLTSNLSALLTETWALGRTALAASNFRTIKTVYSLPLVACNCPSLPPRPTGQWEGRENSTLPKSLPISPCTRKYSSYRSKTLCSAILHLPARAAPPLCVGAIRSPTN